MRTVIPLSLGREGWDEGDMSALLIWLVYWKHRGNRDQTCSLWQKYCSIKLLWPKNKFLSRKTIHSLLRTCGIGWRAWTTLFRARPRTDWKQWTWRRA